MSDIDMSYPDNYPRRMQLLTHIWMRNKYVIKCLCAWHCAEDFRCITSFITTVHDVSMTILLNSEGTQAQRD